MNSYTQYLKTNNLPYCTLYPNVSDTFPIELKVNSFVTCCRLDKLQEVEYLHIQEEYWATISNTFKASDLCFCFKEAILLIQSWEGISDDYQKLNLTDAFHPQQLTLEKYAVGDTILKENLEFCFHEMDLNIPWISAHIFLLNMDWIETPKVVNSAFWLLKLKQIEKKSDWEIIYQLSFNIVVEEKTKVQILLLYNSIEDVEFCQEEIQFLEFL